jgi:hypothetical protein
LTYDGDDIDFTTATGIQYSTIVRQWLSSTTASAPSLAKVLGTGPQTEISAATKHRSTLNTKSIALGFGRRHASPQHIRPSALQKAPDTFRVHSVYQVNNLPLRLKGYLQGEQSKDGSTSFLWPESLAQVWGVNGVLDYSTLFTNVRVYGELTNYARKFHYRGLATIALSAENGTAAPH